MTKRTKILIRYRSGQEQEVTCTSLKVTHSTERGDSRVTAMKWEGMRPSPLFINLDAIESVWEIA